MQSVRPVALLTYTLTTLKSFSLSLEKVSTIPVIGRTSLQCLQEAGAPGPDTDGVLLSHTASIIVSEVATITRTVFAKRYRASCFFFTKQNVGQQLPEGLYQDMVLCTVQRVLNSRWISLAVFCDLDRK